MATIFEKVIKPLKTEVNNKPERFFSNIHLQKYLFRMQKKNNNDYFIRFKEQ